MLKLERGVTLIELMIGMLIGLLVVGIAVQMYVSTLGITRQTTQTVRLNQELRAISDLIVTDLRRAGYWSGATSGVANPYSELVSDGSGGGTHVNVFNAPSGAANGCVVMAYENATPSTSEHFYGYRIAAGGLVEMLTATSYASGSFVDCTTSSATASWDALSDFRTTNIESLVFSFEPAVSWAESSSKSIEFSLIGSARDDAALRREITEQVRIRNEY